MLACRGRLSQAAEKRVRQSEKKRRGGFCQVSSEGDQFVTGGNNAWKFETLHQCAWMSLWGAELYCLPFGLAAF